MRLLSYNIRFGGSRRRALIADVIGSLDPDVVVLQEATEPPVVDWIARRVGMPNVVRRDDWSVAALARLPLTTRAWHRPRPGRGFLEIDSPEFPVRILGVHLTAGLTARGERIRLREAERLVTLVGSAPKPSVVVGDFNSIAPGDRVVVGRWPLWIRILLRVDGGIRHDVLRFLTGNGLVDTYRHLHPEDAGYTLPPRDPSVRLDYLLSTSDALPLVRACAPVLPGDEPLVIRASDHLPLLSVIDT
ncbi:MAG TPA: endonuclease/exonuclease/phosphatase family protein [Candidatus Limnocylindrales bacterium]|nr:endonuclease/exonuclease/phosphatase family protein [Candidatus Limnocylindrales bacterium]